MGKLDTSMSDGQKFEKEEKTTIWNKSKWRKNQWRSQSAADARAQHGHTTFASSLVPRPLPTFSTGNAEATRGSGGGGAPPENF